MQRFLMLGLAILLVSCGPEQSAVDKQKREIQDRVEKDIENVRPILGRYVGLWTGPEGSEYGMTVELREGRELRRIPPTDEVVEVPTINGALFIYDKDPSKTFMNLGEVLSGRYDPKTGSVVLLLGPIPGGGRSGNDANRDFVGTIIDKELKGKFPVNGRLSSVRARKVQE